MLLAMMTSRWIQLIRTGTGARTGITSPWTPSLTSTSTPPTRIPHFRTMGTIATDKQQQPPSKRIRPIERSFQETSHPQPEDLVPKTARARTLIQAQSGKDLQRATSQDTRQSNNIPPTSTTTSTRPIYPTNFRTVPKTERIEALDTASVQELFTQRMGTYSHVTEAFTVKACRMPFREPIPHQVPVFVQKALKEYNLRMQQYQQQLAQLQSTSTPPTFPPRPTLPILQYHQKPLRHYPPTPDSVHPPFRVSYVISKKVVSKLAIHRNLARKKISAAVEATFRDHVMKPGFEFLIFAKKEVMMMSQQRIEGLLKEALKNPRLYGEYQSGISSSRGGGGDRGKGSGKGACSTAAAAAAIVVTRPSTHLINQDLKDLSSKELQPQEPTEQQSFDYGTQPEIKVRWKNNQTPLFRQWWRHAMPHPSARTNQPHAYLDMFVPEAQEALVPIHVEQGRKNKAREYRAIKAQRIKKKKKGAKGGQD